MKYRRFHIPNSLLFLTVVTHQREPVLLHPAVRTAFRRSFAHMTARHPVRMHAYVVMPDHCHMIWAMPPDDGDYSRRMRLLKHHMSCQPDLPRPIWQKRFRDHIIRDENDLARHMDYIHYNPVKHGWAQRATDWPDSSLAAWIQRGAYPPDWHPDQTARKSGPTRM
ncbi:MAG: transposase [Xanthomonadales bacterium]|nr:transposase [Xanthomonadales bacterium]